MKNQKEEILSNQMDNIMKQIEYDDFDDVENMKNHIKKLHNNILLLVRLIPMPCVYKDK